MFLRGLWLLIFSTIQLISVIMADGTRNLFNLFDYYESLGYRLRDPFALLQLDRNSADLHILKQSYRRLILTIHPDKVPVEYRAHATEIFKLIDDAYRTLLPRLAQTTQPNSGSTFTPNTNPPERDTTANQQSAHQSADQQRDYRSEYRRPQQQQQQQKTYQHYGYEGAAAKSAKYLLKEQIVEWLRQKKFIDIHSPFDQEFIRAIYRYDRSAIDQYLQRDSEFANMSARDCGQYDVLLILAARADRKRLIEILIQMFGAKTKCGNGMAIREAQDPQFISSFVA